VRQTPERLIAKRYSPELNIHVQEKTNSETNDFGETHSEKTNLTEANSEKSLLEKQTSKLKL